MKYLMFLFLLASCSTMSFNKGKLKKTNEIAYQCKRGDELYYIVKSDDHYKLLNKIYTNEEQFNLFDGLNPRDKEEYMYQLISSGRIKTIYKFNVVDFNEELESKKSIEIIP